MKVLKHRCWNILLWQNNPTQQEDFSEGFQLANEFAKLTDEFNKEGMSRVWMLLSECYLLGYETTKNISLWLYWANKAFKQFEALGLRDFVLWKQYFLLFVSMVKCGSLQSIRRTVSRL